MTRSKLRQLSVLSILGGATFLAWAAISPIAPVAAQTSPDSASSSQPAAKGADAASAGFDAVFIPSQSFEVRCNPREYHDELRVKSAAQPGDAVTKGAVLLQLDTQKIDVDIAAAANDLAIAQANLTKAQSDVALGDKSDALAMGNAQTSLANAQTALKRWDDIDGNIFVMGSQLGTKAADFQVDNAIDELAQLRKMYKSEDLTGTTEDIVLKRATHDLELQKISASISHANTDKTKDFDAVVKRQDLAQAVDQQTLSLTQLTASQAQAKALRQTSLVTAQAATDQATLKLADLRTDRQNFTVTSPIDGVVVYGSFDNNSWEQADRNSLTTDAKIDSGKVMMTVFTPGSLRLNVECPESQLIQFSPGVKLTVVPDALPKVSYTGTCKTIPLVSRMKDSKRIFDISADLPAVDSRLAPGFGAHVTLVAGNP